MRISPMSLQDILVKILSQAKETAEGIIKEAKTQVELEIIALQNQGVKDQKCEEEKTDKKIQKALQKAESLARMEGRNQVLAKKQESIDLILALVLKSLATLPAKEYEQLLAGMMQSLPQTTGIIHPAVGKENSTKGAIKLAKKEFQVEESKKIEGGFILLSEDADIDFSFETLIYQDLRLELEKYIATQLF